MVPRGWAHRSRYEPRRARDPSGGPITQDALFAGTDEGGENWAATASLIETCKLNRVNPQTYLTDLLTRLVNGCPQARIDEFMPWHRKPTSARAVEHRLRWSNKRRLCSEVGPKRSRFSFDNEQPQNARSSLQRLWPALRLHAGPCAPPTRPRAERRCCQEDYRHRASQPESAILRTACVRTRFGGQPAAAGRHVRCGFRQSTPSSM